MITSFKIFESSYDILLEAKMWEDFKKYFVDFKSLDGVVMTDELGETIFDSDPSENKMYTRWLGNMYKKYNLDDYVKIIEKIQDNLTKYHLGKKKLKDEFQDFKDINKIKNFEEFEKVVNHIVENQYHISKMSLKASRKIKTADDYIEIFDDEEWAVIIPLTWAQSHYWAAGARWCIAANSEENMRGGGHFANYCNSLDSGGAPIYIFHNKKDKLKNKALHFGRGGRWEFQNYENSSDNFNKFIADNSQHDFKGALLNFWDDYIKNPSRYENLKNKWPLAEILIGFVQNFMKNDSARNSNYSILGNMILGFDIVFSSMNMGQKELDSLLVPSLEIGNLKLIKLVLDNNKDIINKPLSNDKTPLMTIVSSGFKTDKQVYEICEYLISLGADGSGTRENGSSNVVVEALMEDRKYFKTAVLLSSLPNYNPNNGSAFNRNEINSMNAYLLNTKLAKETDSNRIGYDDFSTIIGNMVERGLDLNISKYGPRDMPTLLLVVFNYSGLESEELRDNLYNVTKIYLENGANPCYGMKLKPTTDESDKKAIDFLSPEVHKKLYDLIKEYSIKNGCM